MSRVEFTKLYRPFMALKADPYCDTADISKPSTIVTANGA